MARNYFQMTRVPKLRTISCLLFLFVLVNLIAASRVQSGELYRWVDKEGNVHVTETPPDPSECKDNVKNIRASEETVSQKPKIAIYGRDACSLTRRMMSVLNRAGIPYAYGIIDDKEVAKAIEERMRASGIDTKNYDLPVVDVDGRIFVRPNPTEVVNMYKHSR